MYRACFRTVCTARQCAFNAHEACVLPTKYDIAALPGFRLGRSIGVRPLGTSSTSLSENKDNVPPLPQLNDKEDAHKDSDLSSLATATEPGTKEVAVGTAAGTEATKQPEKGADTPLKKAADAGVKKVKMEVKTAKADLLNLLVSMKVDVTHKKRLREKKTTPRPERVERPAPAAMESSRSAFQKATMERALQRDESLSPELVAAASSAAATLPNPRRAESELLKQLRKHEAGSEDHKKGEARLFKGRRLGIFNPATVQESRDQPIEGPTLWDTEYANSLVQSTNQMPRNGLEEEAAVPFHEHVFLDQHLEEGFPRQGPVRHFMELVVSGLSKNHHLSVRQKTEHIDWFRLYFQDKADLLNEAKEMLN
ncbi:hypothetical protein CRUP_011428 [Coryphaenoides rupestris]|nr:hypothetical protein CRUP_011428 [Coryphaenoides rupestris]